VFATSIVERESPAEPAVTDAAGWLAAPAFMASSSSATVAGASVTAGSNARGVTGSAVGSGRPSQGWGSARRRAASAASRQAAHFEGSFVDEAPARPSRKTRMPRPVAWLACPIRTLSRESSAPTDSERER
jgi:hypothetical protein